MYHLCPVGNLHFLEPTRFHMWHFKSFSICGTPQELEEGKFFLENWFQNMKIQIARWRVPQNIQRCLPPIAHIQLEIDYTAVWHSQGSTTKEKPLDYYLTVEDIFTELAHQSKTKIAIPAGTKEINQPIVEPLTDQEKERTMNFNFTLVPSLLKID